MAPLMSAGPLPEGPFAIYLASGPEREGSFSEHLSHLSHAAVVVINVDTELGGRAHDLTDPRLVKQLIEYASNPMCLGVLATIPCSTWSVLRFRALASGISSPLRDCDFPVGIPNPDGSLPAKVKAANTIADNTILIVEACAAHGGTWVIENPPFRGLGSPFAWAGRERHSALWQYPPMARFAERHGSHFVYFDQGAAGAPTQKTTALLCSGNIHRAVSKRFGPLRSTAEQSEQLYGEPESDGFRSAASSHFPSRVNELLAQAFLDSDRPRDDSWMSRVAAVVTPHYDPRAAAAPLFQLSAMPPVDDDAPDARCPTHVP
jgi:hypothetical protein